MSKNLTTSGIARQNVLNNPYALQEIQKAVGMEGVLFEGEYRFTKKQLAQFFEVSERTIENYLEKYENELVKNGYEVLKGKRLIDLKLIIEYQHVNEIDFRNKIPLKEKRLFAGGVEPGMLSLVLFLSVYVIHEN